MWYFGSWPWLCPSARMIHVNQSSSPSKVTTAGDMTNSLSIWGYWCIDVKQRFPCGRPSSYLSFCRKKEWVIRIYGGAAPTLLFFIFLDIFVCADVAFSFWVKNPLRHITFVICLYNLILFTQTSGKIAWNINRMHQCCQSRVSLQSVGEKNLNGNVLLVHVHLWLNPFHKTCGHEGSHTLWVAAPQL